jgi:heterodisulfide reductase subunit A
MVDVAEVARWAAGQPGVAIARHYEFMCSGAGQELIKEDIREQGLDRVVVASCTPRMHEPTFQRAVGEGGLNPYYFEMANIREQCSWVTTDMEEATGKAKALVTAAIARVRHHQPLSRNVVAINPITLIVGGGITGIQAALDI